MRTTRSRLNKGFSLEDRLAGATQSHEPNPSGWRGRWSQWAPHEGSRDDAYQHVVLDLGCGKGEYTVECAAARPDTLFVGIDVDGVCVVRCAERAIAQGVTNAVFVFNEEDRDLSDFFAEGELSAILLNFPTPFPKKKKAPLRLTYLDRLMAYRPLLAKGAPLRLRTDSMPMHEFSLTQLELATNCCGIPTMSALCFPKSLGAVTSRSSWLKAHRFMDLLPLPALSLKRCNRRPLCLW